MLFISHKFVKVVSGSKQIICESLRNNFRTLSEGGGRGVKFFIFPGELKSIDFTSFSCIPLFGGAGGGGTSPFDSWLVTSGPPLASFNRSVSAKKRLNHQFFSKHTRKFLGQTLPGGGYGI